MTKSLITNYLQQGNKSLHDLLHKFSRLKRWNQWLAESLPDESALLSHCQIVALDRGSVIVIADNAHWVARFRFFIPELISKLQQFDDFKEIRAICCKVRPAHYTNTKRAKRMPLIISDQTAEIMQGAAEKIKNTKLKAILLRIAERAKI